LEESVVGCKPVVYYAGHLREDLLKAGAEHEHSSQTH